MLRTILAYGVVAGLIVGVPLSAMTIMDVGHTPSGLGMVIGYLMMLVALSTVFVAVKRRRDVVGGGVIRFWPAFGVGLGISLVASLIYVLAWEAAQAIGHADFGRVYAQAMVEHQAAKGVTGGALAKVTAEAERFRVQYADPLYRLPMTFVEIFPVGVLVSLFTAAVLRNSRFMPARRA